MANTIHPTTHMGAATLVVADLERSLRYYQHNIGLQLLSQEGNTATVGAGTRALLHLVEEREAKPVQQGRTGLYHFAILTPSRYELARTLRNLIDTKTPVGGASDHAVSEALYLNDPDGHGIEIYRDRPRNEWPITNGQLSMTLDPFDFQGVLSELGGNPLNWQGIHPDTTMGHIHLHVAHIPAAEQFYCDLLGFDLMVRYGGQASFISAGGYHHHLGLNTWAGVGAPPPPEDAARLLHYEICLPDGAALTQTVERLQVANWPVEPIEGGWLTKDPAQNSIHLIDVGSTNRV